MKGLLGFLKQATVTRAEASNPDSFLFSTAFAEQGVDASRLVPWEARANEVGAKRLLASRGSKLLQDLWSGDTYMGQLGPDSVARLERFFSFATLPGNRDVIRQEEYSNFMIVLLTGTIAVDREQIWGERQRLTEAHPGDILGEMSLLDSGTRFSVCTSLTDCEIAILDAQALDEMMMADPALAASLVALLARKLSRRLRAITLRLSDDKI